VWERGAVERWAKGQGRSMRSKTTKEELRELKLVGTPLAVELFVAAYSTAAKAAYGHGKRSQEIEATRRAIFEAALREARLADPNFVAERPAGWFDE